MAAETSTSRVDQSVEAMRARLLVLQDPLRLLMTKASGLFEDVYTQAPHPSVRKDVPVYGVWSEDFCVHEEVPKIRELTVVLGAGRWIRVFKTTACAPNAFPRERLWFCRPEGELIRKVNVMRTHSPSRRDIPYDIETDDSDARGICAGLVGFGYVDQEPFIKEADTALDDARGVAETHGLVVVRG